MINVDLFSIIFIAIGLSADCFAVALSGSISIKTPSILQVMRVSLSFGIFQAFMPVLGWLAGQTVVKFISDYDHWLAFILLAFIGSRMIWESFRAKDGHSKNTDITKGFSLLLLSVATSIDALAVGITFAFLKIDIILACSVIGIVALVITAIGFLTGNKLGRLVGKRAETAGGIVLIGIGCRILLEHIL